MTGKQFGRLRQSTDYTAFCSVVGSTLRGLARDQWVFNGCPNTDCDGSLELRFDGGIILLFLDNDGDSVRAAEAELESFSPITLENGETSALMQLGFHRWQFRRHFSLGTKISLYRSELMS